MKFLFREHRRLLSQSLETLQWMHSIPEMVDHIVDQHGSGKILIKQYDKEPDYRIHADWGETWMVLLDDLPIGWMGFPRKPLEGDTSHE